MRKIARGPGGWATNEDLWNMGERCGVGRSFVCLAARSAAVKLRTMLWEHREEPIQEACDGLRAIVINSDQWGRRMEWATRPSKSAPGFGNHTPVPLARPSGGRRARAWAVGCGAAMPCESGRRGWRGRRLVRGQGASESREQPEPGAVHGRHAGGGRRRAAGHAPPAVHEAAALRADGAPRLSTCASEPAGGWGPLYVRDFPSVATSHLPAPSTTSQPPTAAGGAGREQGGRVGLPVVHPSQYLWRLAVGGVAVVRWQKSWGS